MGLLIMVFSNAVVFMSPALLLYNYLAIRQSEKNKLTSWQFSMSDLGWVHMIELCSMWHRSRETAGKVLTARCFSASDVMSNKVRLWGCSLRNSYLAAACQVFISYGFFFYYILIYISYIMCYITVTTGTRRHCGLQFVKVKWNFFILHIMAQSWWNVWSAPGTM